MRQGSNIKNLLKVFNPVTFTIETANEAGTKERAILTITAAEKASRSYKIQNITQGKNAWIIQYLNGLHGKQKAQLDRM